MKDFLFFIMCHVFSILLGHSKHSLLMFKSKILYWKTIKPNLVAFFLLIGMAFSFISEI